MCNLKKKLKSIFSYYRCETVHSTVVQCLSRIKSNILKSVDHQSSLVETENEYMFINFNVFSLQDWVNSLQGQLYKNG